MSPAQTNNATLGIVLIVAGAFVISVQDVVLKLFDGGMTLFQIFALRGVLATALLLAGMAVVGRAPGTLRAALAPWPLIRGALFTAAFLSFYAALPFLSLSTLGAAVYVAPILVALFAALVGGEKVRAVTWAGTLVGFVGVLVLLRPGGDAFSPWALLPLMGAAFYALAHVSTRARCQGVPVAALVLALQIVLAVVSLILSAALVVLPLPETWVGAQPYLLGAWGPVDATNLMFLVLLALIALTIAALLAGAFAAAPAALVATFEYSYLIFAALWDIGLWGTPPDLFTLAGMALIVGAGVLVMQPARQPR